MKKFIFLSFLFCATTLFGQDVSESLAVDIATQYYERVKDDNVNEQVLRIKANNQNKAKRVPELLSDSLRTGVIKTGAIFVDSAYGADFVFDNNYQLRSLQDVYLYIQEHGHLPEIQSAADMQKNGVNMSEFQIQLLQKIEELTLYLIKQEQTIQELREELENVK